ncbi:MAG: hypothetical protein KJ645_00065 [Planctomycetes bacterium]|nr:hypothetical protein [Planctomycetota bacterium]
MSHKNIVFNLFTLIILGYFLLFQIPPATACTAFVIYRSDQALAGNNEDFWNPNTKMWFVPAENGGYGRVYFGFDNFFPQGGMNEAGLFFDGFATAPMPITRSTGKPAYEGNLIDDVMAECATVDEVVEIFSRYNLEFLETAMLMFADRHGHSVIIEGDEFLGNKGDFQVVTNFYQSCTSAPAPCPRFRIATRLLEEAPEANIALCQRVLAATCNEYYSPTQYSNIYDLKNGIVYLYHFHNFESLLKIDLKEELKKGPRREDLPGLFPETYAFISFKKLKEKEIDEVRNKRRAAEVDRSDWDALCGKYALTPDREMGRVFTVFREEDRLMGMSPEKQATELITEGKDRFFIVGYDGSYLFTFIRDESGKIESVTIEEEGLQRETVARRL